MDTYFVCVRTCAMTDDAGGAFLASSQCDRMCPSVRDTCPLPSQSTQPCIAHTTPAHLSYSSAIVPLLFPYLPYPPILLITNVANPVDNFEG